MTHKYMLDETSQALHKVVGYAHTWEQLAPGIRVRRRVSKPFRPVHQIGVASWISTFSADVEGSLPAR